MKLELVSIPKPIRLLAENASAQERIYLYVQYIGNDYRMRSNRYRYSVQYMNNTFYYIW